MWPACGLTRPELVLLKDGFGVDRHVGMWCGCLLLDCCHNEDQPPCSSGPRVHVHSGSPVSGYLMPWEPGDESWRDETGPLALLPVARRIWLA